MMAQCPATSPPAKIQNESFINTSRKRLKNRNSNFPAVRYFTRKPELVSNIPQNLLTLGIGTKLVSNWKQVLFPIWYQFGPNPMDYKKTLYQKFLPIDTHNWVKKQLKLWTNSQKKTDFFKFTKENFSCSHNILKHLKLLL